MCTRYFCKQCHKNFPTATHRGRCWRFYEARQLNPALTECPFAEVEMEAGPHQDFIRCGSMRVFCDQCRRERKCLREKSRRERKKIAARYAQAATLILFSETASRGDAEGAAGKLVEGSKSETAPSKSEKIPRLKLFSGEARRLEADEAERTNAAGERERLRVQKAELDSLWALAAQREQINKMFSEKPEPQAADQARCCRGSIQVNNDDVQTSEVGRSRGHRLYNAERQCFTEASRVPRFRGGSGC